MVTLTAISVKSTISLQKKKTPKKPKERYSVIDWLIDFNGMSTCRGYLMLGDYVHNMFIFSVFV